MPAISAEYCFRVPFIYRPNIGSVTGGFRVAFKTRKPPFTAFEFDRNNVEIGVIVGTACLSVDADTGYFFAMYSDRHYCLIVKLRRPVCTNTPTR